MQEIKLIGLALKTKTTNENGQSMADCGNLWQQFESKKITARIPDKLDNTVYAVYHQYEGDHMQPFSYFIGCPVKMDAEVPEGLDSLTIPAGTYQKVVAKGKMPDCIGIAWKGIWESDIDRAFLTDFEVYDERSYNWEDAVVDIFLSVGKIL